MAASCVNIVRSVAMLVEVDGSRYGVARHVTIHVLNESSFKLLGMSFLFLYCISSTSATCGSFEQALHLPRSKRVHLEKALVLWEQNES